MLAFFAFVFRLSSEYHARVKHEVVGRPVMRRRRCQFHWLLDRTTLASACYVIQPYSGDPPRMLYILAAVVWLGNWQNVEAAGGVAYLSKTFDRFDESEICAKWQNVTWRAKGYGADKNLALWVPSNKAVPGLVRYFKLWRLAFGQEVLQELQATPTAEHAEKVVWTLARMPKIAGLVFRRLLSVWDSRLFQHDAAEYGLGAQPTMDWLCGDDVAWSTLSLLKYTPVAGRDYAAVLREVTAEGARWWYSQEGAAVNCQPWIVPAAQVFEGSLCEQRKKFCERWQHRVAKGVYAPTAGYADLVALFESHFVRDGRFVSVLERGNAPLHALADAPAPPPAKRRKRLACEGKGLTFNFDGRSFKTVNDFCAHSGQGKASAPGRLRIESYVEQQKLARSDTLVLLQTAPNNLSKFHKQVGNNDFRGSGRAMLLSELGDLRCTAYRSETKTLLYDILVLARIAG